WQRRLAQALRDGLAQRRTDLAHLSRVLQRSSPAYIAGTWRLALDEATARLLRAGGALAPLRRTQVGSLGRRLRACAPRTEPLRECHRLLTLELHRATANRLAAARSQLAGLRVALSALNPQATLERGYAIVHSAGFRGPVLSDGSRLAQGDRLAIRLSRGGALATVDRALPDIHGEEDESR
ncbi:MAG: hypothetical protein HPY83_18060, partial [Anaerolineae bacterium]|nr:hypothetical protein [Anaerolineae bacterium]